MQVKEQLIAKFEEISGINFDDMLKEKHNIKMASFNKFAITDELNLRALKAQGFNQEFIKLDTLRNAHLHSESKTVYLFMIEKNSVKKFYPCIVVDTREKMETVKTQKNDISVVPQKMKSDRREIIIDTPAVKSKRQNISPDETGKKVIESKPVEYATKEEFDKLNEKLDLLLNYTLEKKVSILDRLKK